MFGFLAWDPSSRVNASHSETDAIFVHISLHPHHNIDKHNFLQAKQFITWLAHSKDIRGCFAKLPCKISSRTKYIII